MKVKSYFPSEQIADANISLLADAINEERTLRSLLAKYRKSLRAEPHPEKRRRLERELEIITQKLKIARENLATVCDGDFNTQGSLATKNVQGATSLETTPKANDIKGSITNGTKNSSFIEETSTVTKPANPDGSPVGLGRRRSTYGRNERIKLEPIEPVNVNLNSAKFNSKGYLEDNNITKKKIKKSGEEIVELILNDDNITASENRTKRKEMDEVIKSRNLCSGSRRYNNNNESNNWSPKGSFIGNRSPKRATSLPTDQYNIRLKLKNNSIIEDSDTFSSSAPMLSTTKKKIEHTETDNTNEDRYKQMVSDCDDGPDNDLTFRKPATIGHGRRKRPTSINYSSDWASDFFSSSQNSPSNASNCSSPTGSALKENNDSNAVIDNSSSSASFLRGTRKSFFRTNSFKYDRKNLSRSNSLRSPEPREINGSGAFSPTLVSNVCEIEEETNCCNDDSAVDCTSALPDDTGGSICYNNSHISVASIIKGTAKTIKKTSGSSADEEFRHPNSHHMQRDSSEIQLTAFHSHDGIEQDPGSGEGYSLRHQRKFSAPSNMNFLVDQQQKKKSNSSIDMTSDDSFRKRSRTGFGSSFYTSSNRKDTRASKKCSYSPASGNKIVANLAQSSSSINNNAINNNSDDNNDNNNTIVTNNTSNTNSVRNAIDVKNIDGNNQPFKNRSMSIRRGKSLLSRLAPKGKYNFSVEEIPTMKSSKKIDDSIILLQSKS
eukprot:Awhi_evm1s652